MSARTRAKSASLLLAAIILILPACGNNQQETKEEVGVKTPVTVVPASLKPVESVFYLQASAQFQHTGIVRTTATGSIAKVLINQWDHVKSGQLLFTVKTKEASAVSGRTIIDSTLTFNGLINIYSNKDGIVSSIAFQKGDFVQEGDELAKISEQESLVFIMDVPFEYNSYIEKNKKCIIRLPDNSELTGSIAGKLSEMDGQSQTLRYIVRPSSTRGLPANLIASIKLLKESNANAVILPKNAILGNEALTEFWVMKLINDSTAVKVDIKKGFENNEEVEITEPSFLDNDRFVLTGNYGLPDTAGVSIIRE